MGGGAPGRGARGGGEPPADPPSSPPTARPPSGARHLRQNLALGRFVPPHAGHAASRGALHSSQKSESARFSVWHLGHFIRMFCPPDSGEVRIAPAHFLQHPFARGGIALPTAVTALAQ